MIIENIDKTQKDDIVSTEAEEWVKTLFDDICTQYNTTNSSIDWNLVREVANHFPESKGRPSPTSTCDIGSGIFL